MTCPVRDRCGGCPMMSATLDEQRLVKVERIGAALAWPVDAITWAGGDTFGYRRRIRMSVDERGAPCFFNEHKARDCAVLSAPLLRAIDKVRQVRLPGAEHVEVRAPDLDGRAGLFIGATSGSVPSPHALPRFVVGDRDSEGPATWQRYAVTGEVWSYVPLTGFLQVHDGTNRLLVEALVRGARERGVVRFFDPYAGAGNFSLALSASGMRGVAGDRHQPCMAALGAAAAEQGLDLETASYEAQVSIGSWCGDIDLLVANPPRAGLRDLSRDLASLGAEHIALVTCTTEALERDVSSLVRHGYGLEHLMCFDMFPHTAHVETLAWLRRR